jgi:hypothetical protein
LSAFAVRVCLSAFAVFFRFPGVTVVGPVDKLVPAFTPRLSTVLGDSGLVVENTITTGSAFWHVLGQGGAIVVWELSELALER